MNTITSEDTAVLAFSSLSRATEKVASVLSTLWRTHSLTSTQFNVLENLADQGPLTQRQLCDKISKTSGDMTMVVDNLVRNRLVTRSRMLDDRRCNEIRLTHKGRRLIERASPSVREQIVHAFSTLTLKEQETLAKLCGKLGKMGLPKEALLGKPRNGLNQTLQSR